LPRSSRSRSSRRQHRARPLPNIVEPRTDDTLEVLITSLDAELQRQRRDHDDHDHGRAAMSQQ
jgi:hypothetical protein